MTWLLSWRTVFFISLAFNLCGLGMVGGAFYHERHEMHKRREVNYSLFIRALDPKDRAALRDRLVENGFDPKKLRRDIQTDWNDLLAVIQTDPLPVPRLRAILERQEQRTMGKLRLEQQMLYDWIMAMPAGDRRAFAGRLNDMRAQWAERK